MADRVVVRRPDTLGEYDADTFEHTETAGAVVYEGPAFVVPVPRRDARVVMAGDQPVTLRHYYVNVPPDATGIQVDDVATVTTNDAHLNGRPLRVLEVQGATEAPFRRLVCEDDLQ